MQTRPLGARTGSIRVTALGFGGAPLGNLYTPITDARAVSTLEAAWDAGIRVYDTAPLYGLGLSETRFGSILPRWPRDAFVVSTKIGRVLRDCEADAVPRVGFHDTPSRTFDFDYSRDGVRRSLDGSLQRLGLDRVDILLVHDVDVFTHGSPEASQARISELFDGGGYRALDDLRAAGVVGAIGAGVNEWQVCQTLASLGDFDCFLLAGRYTLLEQEALESFLPLCEKRGIGIILGGPFNSGILATGAAPGAWYNYAPAPPEILDRVTRIERVCRAHGVALAEAALQFVLAHPAVTTVIPGANSPEQVQANAALLQARIPPGLWSDLKTTGLVRKDAPIPAT
jgi:D-threo-aldose 1-dehydrogenase